MRRLFIVLTVAVPVLLWSGAALGQGEPEQGTKLWLGSHYTDLQDYTKKVGEYNLGNSEWLPEFRIDYFRQAADYLLTLDGQYFDNKNISGKVSASFADRLSAQVQYRSLIRQQGQDLLGNLETREWMGASAGGKILTHEITDPHADYNYNRNEILTKVSVLLSRKNNIRLHAAHRSILKSGEEQKISSTHCFSCHVSSQTVDIKKQTHAIETGVQAEVGKYDVGYVFGYRMFKSTADDPTARYDSAAHPVSGGSGDMLASRLIYEDTTLVFGVYPEKEKMSHKLRFKGDIGNVHFSSSLGYSQTKNKDINLKSDAIMGAVNLAVLLSKRTRLIAKLSGTRLTADDPLFEAGTFQEGTGAYERNFDTTFYSSLDRLDGRATAELITRVNPQTTLSLLAGYNHIDRYDYLGLDSPLETDRFIGQAKIRYRNGMKISHKLKYRFERTVDPFVSGKGLFEANGRDYLNPLGIGVPYYYFQREDIRYQQITTEPTDYHGFELASTFRLTNKASVNIGFRSMYDKNREMDSLDVEHFSIQPSVGLTVTPDPKWSFAAGYQYLFSRSRAPVTVALFDG